MKKNVVPGESLGAEIEFLPGNGTYSENEEVKSALVGEAGETADRKIEVSPAKSTPAMLAPGMKVLGRIDEIHDPVALIRVEGIGEEGIRPIANTYYCVLHASRIKRGFVKSVRDEMRIGDVIKAVVSEIKGEDVHLSTSQDGLGVVKAFCSRCREPLSLAQKGLECSACGNQEFRKIGSPYRSM